MALAQPVRPVVFAVDEHPLNQSGPSLQQQILAVLTDRPVKRRGGATPPLVQGTGLDLDPGAARHYQTPMPGASACRARPAGKVVAAPGKGRYSAGS